MSLASFSLLFHVTQVEREDSLSTKGCGNKKGRLIKKRDEEKETKLHNRETQVYA
jgi:hypothetical protein